MIIVIADDITGAAEIAGLAHRHGLAATLTVCDGTAAATPPLGGAGGAVAVFATDTRSMPAEAAARVVASLTAAIATAVPLADGRHTLFRKTDSALRGNIAEETAACLANSPYTAALHLPANPSKGRVIVGGVYYINNVPLAETPFRHDPEYPAVTSRVAERFPTLTFADAATLSDVRRIVAATPATTLLCGAADLFEALLERETPLCGGQRSPSAALPRDGRMLVVRGSTLSQALPLGLPVEEMPDSVFYGEESAERWAREAAARYKAAPRGTILAVGSGKALLEGREAAVRIRTAMAETVAAMVAAALPEELVIEGGATAYAILSRLPFASLAVTDEFAPGVVRLKAAAAPVRQATPDVIHITLKPGSYDWGNLWAQ